MKTTALHVIEANELQRQIIREMTPEKRLNVAERLYWSARELKAVGIRMQHPELSEEEIQERAKRAFMYARS